MIYGLPEKLRTMRAKYGFSQHDVAKRLDVSPSIISGYESGERTPSVNNLLSLAYLYNCSVDYLLGKKQSDTSIFIDTDGLTDAQIRLITDLANELRKK